MNMKKIWLLLLFLIPLGLMAQTGAEKALQFLEGGSVIEDWFMKDFLGSYRDILMKNSEKYVDIAKAIAGIFALIYFSTIAWNMMTGDKEFKILPLLKPFGILILILNWQFFINGVNAPFHMLATSAEADYVETVGENRNLRISRHTYQMAVIDAMANVSADNDIASETAKKSFLDNMVDMGKDAIDLVVKPIYAFQAKIQLNLQFLVSQLLELIALWILRISIYVLFTMQMIYTAILVFLGPISVAFSILPAFANSFKHWLARYISVQFYLTIAFIVLEVTSVLQKVAYTQEIDRYQDMINIDGTIKSQDMLVGFMMNGITSFGIVIITFVVSAIGMLAVPKIASWIIPSGGTSGLVTGAARTVGMGMGAKLLK